LNFVKQILPLNKSDGVLGIYFGVQNQNRILLDIIRIPPMQIRTNTGRILSFVLKMLLLKFCYIVLITYMWQVYKCLINAFQMKGLNKFNERSKNAVLLQKTKFKYNIKLEHLTLWKLLQSQNVKSSLDTKDNQTGSPYRADNSVEIYHQNL
jgi:hypothetical protein